MSTRGSPNSSPKHRKGPSLRMRRLRVGISALNILVSLFDVGTDWWAFSEFFTYDVGRKSLTIALGVVCAVSTVLLFMELYQAVSSFAVYLQRRRGGDGAEGDGEEEREKQRREENHVERLQEITTFLLLIFEDIPSAVIMYAAFRYSDCSLFTRLFDNSLVAYITLSGVFISAAWKGLQSLVYCVLCCRFYDLKRCEDRAACCICRILRPFIAAVLILFVSLMFFYLNWNSSLVNFTVGDVKFGLDVRNCSSEAETFHLTTASSVS